MLLWDFLLVTLGEVSYLEEMYSYGDIRWKIGDGQSVHIWRDPWIPQPLLFRAITPIRMLPEDAKLCVN